MRRLKECGKELTGVKTYREAIEIMERYDLLLAEYGEYKKKPQQGYVFYNRTGERDMDTGILIVYTWKKVEGRDSFTADMIVSIDIYAD